MMLVVAADVVALHPEPLDPRLVAPALEAPRPGLDAPHRVGAGDECHLRVADRLVPTRSRVVCDRGWCVNRLAPVQVMSEGRQKRSDFQPLCLLIFVVSLNRHKVYTEIVYIYKREKKHKPTHSTQKKKKNPHKKKESSPNIK